jgi:hypothetical protein
MLHAEMAQIGRRCAFQPLERRRDQEIIDPGRSGQKPEEARAKLLLAPGFPGDRSWGFLHRPSLRANSSRRTTTIAGCGLRRARTKTRAHVFARRSHSPPRRRHRGGGGEPARAWARGNVALFVPGARWRLAGHAIRCEQDALQDRRAGSDPGGSCKAEKGKHHSAFPRLHPASLMIDGGSGTPGRWTRSSEPELTVIGTTSGGMSFGEAFYRRRWKSAARGSARMWLANYLPQKPVLDAQEACGFASPSQIIANACASGTNAVGHAFRPGQERRVQRRVLCGGYDIISEMVFVGFDSLQASTPEKIRPFDKNRTGLVLGEGAALLALEEWGSAHERGAPSSRRSPATASPRTTITSPSRTPAESVPARPWSAPWPMRDGGPGDRLHQCPRHGDRLQRRHRRRRHFAGIREPRAGQFHKIDDGPRARRGGRHRGGVFRAGALEHQFLPPNIHLREPDPTWVSVAPMPRSSSRKCKPADAIKLHRSNLENLRTRLGHTLGRRS